MGSGRTTALWRLSWSFQQRIFTRAAHGFEVGDVSGGDFCAGAQSEGGDEAINQTRLAFAEAAGFASERRCFGIICWLGGEGWQMGNSIGIELSAALAQCSVTNCMNAEQKFASDDVSGGNLTGLLEPGFERGVAAFAFDEDVSI